MQKWKIRVDRNWLTQRKTIMLLSGILFSQVFVLPESSAQVLNTQPTDNLKIDDDLAYWNSLPPSLDPRIDGNIVTETNTNKLSSAFPDAATVPIFIDNDEAKTAKSTIEYKELPTDEGKTRIKAGAEFPVVVMSEVSSKTAHEGDAFQARLKYDLKIGDRLVASKGSMVNAHVNYCLKSRCILHSMMSLERWYRNSGCLGITFDEIINEHGEHIPLAAAPARRSLIVRNKGEGRLLGVNHQGQITGPWSQQIRYEALRVGVNAALAPAGIFSFGALPAALGVIGAMNPSFAFMKPVGLNVRHRRLKGFAFGFIDGLPGGFLVQDTVIKGQEAVIKPGDEFLCEFKEEFTGEPATEAQLIPGATTRVHGQVVPK